MTTPYEKELDVIVERLATDPARKTLNWTAAAGGIVLLGALLAMSADTMHGLSAVMLALGGILLRVGLAPGRKETRLRTKTQAVRITEVAVETDDAAVPLASIAQAYVQPHGDRRSTVRLVDRSGHPLFEAAVDTEREGDDFLRALGRDVQHHRATWKVISPLVATGPRRALMFFGTLLSSIAFGFALAALGATSVFIAVSATLAFLVSWSLAIRTSHIDVGADGLLLRYLWTRRFVPWSQVASVDHAASDGVRVEVKGQRPLRLEDPTTQSTRTAETRALLHASLRARIVDAWQLHRIRTGETAVHEQLDRGERAVGEWRKSLVSLRSADGGYRQTATRDEDLWRVVEDVTAPEQARAAAALALRGAEDAPARLRVAAEAVASPRLRVALETAADREAEDAALDEALERVAARE